MKQVSLVILFVCLPAMCLSYEMSMLNLSVPSNLERGQMEFKVQHRFFGPVDEDPFDTFFGMDGGANVGLTLRGPVWRKLEVSSSYVMDFSKWLVDLSYTVVLPDSLLRAKAEVELFSFEQSPVSGRETALFYQAALQTAPLPGGISPVLNVGYDAHTGRGGLGFGARVNVLENLSLQGEYYPIISRDDDDPDSPLGPENAFAFGLELQTYGHHFVLMVGNSTDIGARCRMLGAYSNDLRFGFNIQRLFDL
jgi:hypothetical protein